MSDAALDAYTTQVQARAVALLAIAWGLGTDAARLVAHERAARGGAIGRRGNGSRSAERARDRRVGYGSSGAEPAVGAKTGDSGEARSSVQEGGGRTAGAAGGGGPSAGHSGLKSAARNACCHANT